MELVLRLHPATNYFFRSNNRGAEHLLLLPALLQEEDYQVQRIAFYHVRWNDPRRYRFRPGS